MNSLTHVCHMTVSNLLCLRAVRLFIHIIYLHQVATALLVAGSTHLLHTLADSVCIHQAQALFKAHNSTTMVSFCTIIIRLCHCMIAIMRV